MLTTTIDESLSVLKTQQEAVAAREGEIKQREETVAKQEEALTTREGTLQQREEAAIVREEAVAKQEEALATREGSLQTTGGKLWRTLWQHEEGSLQQREEAWQYGRKL